MSKWIEVHSLFKNDKVLINTNNISSVVIDVANVTTIFFISGNEEDYIKVHNSYDEIKEMILND